MSKRNKAAIYIRVSTEREEQQTSLRNQTELCMEVIQERALELYDVYTDFTSGRTRERKDFKRLLADIENDVIQYVVVKEGSRLTRNVSTYEYIRQLATKRNVHLLSVDGELDTISKGYECVTQVATDAQKEAEKISKRVKNALRMQAKRGEFIGSIPPFGYRLEKKRLYVRDDNTPDIVRRIFYSYLEGKGAKKIAQELQKEGIPTPSMVAGKKNATGNWNDTTIYNILENRAYVGDLIQSEEETYIAGEERRRKQKTADSFIIVRDTHEPIVPLEVFENVQAVKAAKPKAGAKGQEHLFSNILFCKDCGSRLIFKSSWKKGSYICSRYAKHGSISCSNHAINEKELLVELRKALNEFSKPNLSDVFEKAERRLKKVVRNLEGKIDARQFEVRRIQSRIDSLEDEMLDHPLRKGELTLQYEKQLNKLAETRGEIAKVQKLIRKLSTTTTTETVENALEVAFQLRELNLMTINLLVSRIDVSDDKTLEVIYRFNNRLSS